MKNTTRVQGNIGATAVPAQAKSQRPPNKPTDDKLYYTLTLTAYPHGFNGEHEIQGEIDIPVEEFISVQVASVRLKDEGLNDLLAEGWDAMKHAEYFCDSEIAMRQSNALLALMFDALDKEDDDAGLFSGTDGESLRAGLQDLIWETQRRSTKSALCFRRRAK